MVVYENFFLVQSEFCVHGTTKKIFLIGNHCKTIYEPVRIGQSSYRCSGLHSTVIIMKYATQGQTAVADPGFPRGGLPITKIGALSYYFSKFSPKTA